MRRSAGVWHRILAIVLLVPLGLPLSGSAAEGARSLEAYLSKGSNFVASQFRPDECGIASDAVDAAKDYCFASLDQAVEKLKDVDRRLTLKALFQTITAGAATNTDRHKRVLYFLQRAIHHNRFWMPLHRDRTMVTDPLIILELGEGQCGQIARVAVDLFRAGGYDGRLVQLGGHIIAEVLYDGSWHYLDADLFGGGQVVVINGRIPSVRELSMHPRMIDAIATNHRFGVEGTPWELAGTYPSYFYFSSRSYVGHGPQVYEKTGTADQEKEGVYYGWEHVVTHSYDIELTDEPARPSPPAAVVTSVVREGSHALLRWSPSAVADVVGYRVHVGSKSRGWAYDRPMSEGTDASPAGWNWRMYDNLYRQPPSDIARLTVAEPEVRVPITRKAMFITVSPIDKYGKSVGRRLYPMSQEIVVRRH